MKKKITDKLTGEKVYFDKVYYRIYGLNNDSLREKSINENKNKYKYLILIFGLLLILNLISVISAGDGNLIKIDGYVKAISRPDKGIYNVNLIAEIDGKNFSFKQEIPIKISAAGKRQVPGKLDENPVDQESAIRVQLNKLLNSISQIDNSNAGTIMLPQEMEDGSNLKWHVKNNSNFVYLSIFFILSISVIYFGRYSNLKKMEREAKESILTELPDFINKIVLLMNAGLVFSSAFSRVVDQNHKNEDETYFLKQMISIKEKVEATNSSLIFELKNFSERIQVRELIRTVNIISDNIYLGALLVEKLQNEGDLLWENRRKFAEEQNRISETKLSFPLAIHLIVLITITISPALITT
ncbi:MAG: hypothetical protein JJE49_00850 [Peptostreptococcaceae bacterium]|nr:hypothetical protein [Peptostreptococcaceae bacterium]